MSYMHEAPQRKTDESADSYSRRQSAHQAAELDRRRNRSMNKHALPAHVKATRVWDKAA